MLWAKVAWCNVFWRKCADLKTSQRGNLGGPPANGFWGRIFTKDENLGRVLLGKRRIALILDAEYSETAGIAPENWPATHATEVLIRHLFALHIGMECEALIWLAINLRED